MTVQPSTRTSHGPTCAGPCYAAPATAPRTRPFTPHAGNWLRTRIRATLNFLTWLNEQNLTLARLTQTASTPTDATYAAREFLHWARKHDLTGEVSTPNRPMRSSLPPITEDARWAQLRRCLHEQTLPTEVRAAGTLVLLFGLPVSRVTALRHTDIHSDPDGVSWLFPSGLPGRPARDAVRRKLRTHLPVHLRRARSAALAAERPAAVLAKLLDININTANPWANDAQYDWTAYLAAHTITTSDTRLSPI